MSTKAKRELNDNQRKFVVEYVKDFNATSAYIRAGYSKNGARHAACLLLTNVNIAKAVKKHIENIEERAIVTEADVLNGLLVEAKGVEDSTASSRVTAWTQLGKTLAMFTERVQHGGEVKLTGFDVSGK